MSHAVGVGVCFCSACGLTLIFRNSSLKAILPFLFLAIILLVALSFSSTSGIIGTVTAGLIFAGFLFQPTLNLRVEDPVEKSNLIWMVLVGIIVSELLGTRSRTSEH